MSFADNKSPSPSKDQKQQPANDNKIITRQEELQILSEFLSKLNPNRRLKVEHQLLYRVRNGVLESARLDHFGMMINSWGPFSESRDASRLQRWVANRVAYKDMIEMHRKNHQLAGFVEMKRAARVASKNVSCDISGVADLF